jgi:phosphohistidine phosphatase
MASDPHGHLAVISDTNNAGMDLILWRHADAMPEDEGSDLARRLTAKGKKQAAAMASWLDHRLPEGARVLCSPATRAIETAEELVKISSGRKLSVKPELGVGAMPAHLLIAANWPESRSPIVIVGHQPTLGRLISLMLCGEEHDLAIRKASVWWLTNRHQKTNAPSAAEMEAFKPVALRASLTPDML